MNWKQTKKKKTINDAVKKKSILKWCIIFKKNNVHVNYVPGNIKSVVREKFQKNYNIYFVLIYLLLLTNYMQFT